MTGIIFTTDLQLRDLVSFDPEQAVASVPLKAWPPVLSRALEEVFNVEDAVLRLDLTHLSAEPSGNPLHRYDDRSERQRVVEALIKAADSGCLELFIEILQGQQAVLEDSASVRDREGLGRYRGDRAEGYVCENLGELRQIAFDEGTFGSRWVRFALTSYRRYEFLRDSELIVALLRRVDAEAEFLGVMEALTPRQGEDGGAFAKFAEDNWPQTQAFIEANIKQDRKRWSSKSCDLLVGLFRHSPSLQQSRWACEQVLERAHPSMLADLVAHSQVLSADDVRGLLQRLRDGDDEVEAGVRSAFFTISSLTQTALPSDLALAGLWLNCEFAHHNSPTPLERQVVASLRELPTGEWGSHTLWDQLGTEARAAWRHDLAERLVGDAALSMGLLDFACRWLDQAAFVEIEPILRRLVVDNADLAFLQRLAKGGPRLVTLRALGLTQSQLEETASDTITNDELYGGLPDVGARTWLGDPAAERVIHRLVAGVETAFTMAYRGQWGSDEEALTADLLAETRIAAQKATQQLRRLARINKGRYPAISVDVRQPGKIEEGRKTSAGAPLAADILFLTKIKDGARVLVERATFIQVKKRRGGAGDEFGATVAIDFEQCEDLLTQSEHAFYLFLTPPEPQPRLWVTPARLVRNLTQLHTSRSSVNALQARDSSCSYTDFFLKNLVGLWSGDERQSVINIAKGDPSAGKSPRHVVEIVVQRRVD